jgi:AAA domain
VGPDAWITPASTPICNCGSIRTALEGIVGAGKTTALAAVRDAAERERYQVEGLAPPSRATHKLAESGIESHTLQHHVARGEQGTTTADPQHLYVLDESSLASTKQMHTFLERFGPQDRVLLGRRRPSARSRRRGPTVSPAPRSGHSYGAFGRIVHQRDPELKAVVEQALAR